MTVPMAQALKTALYMFDHGARGSGRTYRMIQGLTPKDVVIVHDTGMRRWMQDEIAKQGKKNEVFVASPNLQGIDRLICERLAGRNVRLVFDHAWEQRWYEDSIEWASKTLRGHAALLDRTPVLSGEDASRPFNLTKHDS